VQKFCVTGQKGLYVHRMLSKFRTDKMPRYFLKKTDGSE